ncbi:MAG TPA: hypothetical protein ENJ31_04630 [Anaerolineae bacterium]|nr:hypothetical protein [Anaerolineae bacterium]
MTFPRTELLFPPRLIPDLKDLRGREWRKLIEYLTPLPETHPDTLAFCLMMIRLNACLGCVSGSYRFMRGCEICSQQTIARYQGSDEELIKLFSWAKRDLERYAEGQTDDLMATSAAAPEPELAPDEDEIEE